MPGPDLKHSDLQAACLRLETGSQVPAKTRRGLDARFGYCARIETV